MLTPFALSGIALALAAGITTTTPEDFVQPGSQPGSLTVPVFSAEACTFCHAGFDPDDEPYERWSASLMAQAARDPIFHAALAVAEQDMAGSGELCIRCHSPGGWLAGHSTPSDGSALTGTDFEGVTCHFCHRLVDPFADLANPPEDTAILAALAQVPITPGTGQYVVDPFDRRRGPFDLGPGFFWHAWLQSSYHQEALLCATCHDVSNPALTRVGGPTPSATDTYEPNAPDTQHPTHVKYDQYPIERTWSEWSQSAFAQGPIEMGGRFGGNKTAVSTCQDCHMPDTTGTACAPGLDGVLRDDLPQHDFNGANTWVLRSILSLDQNLLLYGPDEASGLTAEVVDAAIARNLEMLSKASDLELEQVEHEVNARIVNQTAHKLPSGYGEGRRMWLDVRFVDGLGRVVAEHGAYDPIATELDEPSTKVYEFEQGLDAVMAAASAVPEGPSFHFILNNKVYKDNRIPPRGFTNAGFESVQAQPVRHEYADGQYWDDTLFPIPCEAETVEVRVWYQTTTREYVEFLRDENVTNGAGIVAYEEYVAAGKSAPALMDEAVLELPPRLVPDVESVSLARGGTQSLCIRAGAEHAGELYWLLGSASGTAPGIDLGVGVGVLPLNADRYLFHTRGLPNRPPLSGSLGTLDRNGAARARFSLSPGFAGPGLAGVVFHHAYVVIGVAGVEAVSNAAAVRVVP